MTGMNPDAVLDESQKKVRFRKLLMKRQRLQSHTPELGFNDDDSDQEEEETVNHNDEGSNNNNNLKMNSEDDYHSNNNDDVNKESEQNVFLLSEPPPLIEIRPIIPSSNCQNSEPFLNVTEEESMFVEEEEDKENVDNLLHKIKVIVRNYQMALAQTKCLKSEDLFAKLNAIQRGETGISISKADVLFLITKMSSVFRHFALLQR